MPDIPELTQVCLDCGQKYNGPPPTCPVCNLDSDFEVQRFEIKHMKDGCNSKGCGICAPDPFRL